MKSPCLREGRPRRGLRRGADGQAHPKRNDIQDLKQKGAMMVRLDSYAELGLWSETWGSVRAWRKHETGGGGGGNAHHSSAARRSPTTEGSEGSLAR